MFVLLNCLARRHPRLRASLGSSGWPPRSIDGRCSKQTRPWAASNAATGLPPCRARRWSCKGSDLTRASRNPPFAAQVSTRARCRRRRPQRCPRRRRGMGRRKDSSLEGDPRFGASGPCAVLCGVWLTVLMFRLVKPWSKLGNHTCEFRCMNSQPTVGIHIRHENHAEIRDFTDLHKC